MQVPGTALQEGYILCDMAPHKIPHLFANDLGPQPPKYKEGSLDVCKSAMIRPQFPLLTFSTVYIACCPSLSSVLDKCVGYIVNIQWLSVSAQSSSEEASFTDSFLSAILFSGKKYEYSFTTKLSQVLLSARDFYVWFQREKKITS